MIFYFKVSLRAWKKHPWTQIFTVISFGMLLFICTFFYWAMKTVDPILSQLKKDQVLTVYLKGSHPEGAEQEVIDSLKFVMSSSTSVKSDSNSQYQLELVKPEAFLGRLEGVYPDLTKELRGMGQEMVSLLPRFISMSGLVEPGLIEKIKSLPQIESVESSMGRFTPMISALESFKNGALVFLLGILLTLATVFFLITKMNQSLYSETLTLFKLMGADTFSLKTPGLLSGLLTGLLGGLFCVSLWFLMSASMLQLLRAISPFFKNIQPPSVIVMVATPMIIGVLLGLVFGFLNGGELKRRKV